MGNQYFELHVTVQPNDVLAFAAFCSEIKAKPLYIQLNQGQHPDQLMLATTNMLPDDNAAKAWASDYTNMMKTHFSVLRTKLESRLVEGPNEYYEAHWKLDYAQGYDYWSCATLDLVMMYPYLLRSRNLLDTRIHYLSQRIYNSMDSLAASRTFNGSGVKINFHGLPLTKVHYERCVFDNNPAIDNGWAT